MSQASTPVRVEGYIMKCRAPSFWTMMVAIVVVMALFAIPAQADVAKMTVAGSLEESITPAITPAMDATCAAEEVASAVLIGVTTRGDSESMAAMAKSGEETAFAPKTAAGAQMGTSTRAAGLRVAFTPAPSAAFSGIFCS